MSKLNELLASQTKLTAEVEGLRSFLNVVHGKAPLRMEAGGEVMEFEEADLGVELKILKVLRDDFEARVAKLESVNRKVAVLEELVG